jgi:hypothetical protein
LLAKSESLRWSLRADGELVPVLEENLALGLRGERALVAVGQGAAHGLLQVPLLVEFV